MDEALVSLILLAIYGDVLRPELGVMAQGCATLLLSPAGMGWGLGTGDWGLRAGDWGLGAGDWGLGAGGRDGRVRGCQVPEERDAIYAPGCLGFGAS